MMSEFNVLGALALASIAGFAATQSTAPRPATIRQPADSFDRSARAGASLERNSQKTGK